MALINEIFKRFSGNARARRAAVFRSLYPVSQSTKIIDIGSETGENISAVLAGMDFLPENVFIADIDPEALAEGSRRFGFSTVLLDESGKLPFPDGFFDIVYCSSVIEHVTIPKQEVWDVTSGTEFRKRSCEKQGAFAREIVRIGRSYFVQTPNRYYPVESHSWLPVIGVLPRRIQVPLLRLSNRVWVKKTIPDWHLITKTEFHRLFPDAEIIREKAFGMTKSLIAVKGPQTPNGESN